MVPPSPARPDVPADLRWEDGGRAVRIAWEDGHVSVYTASYLRAICPCATCRGVHETPPVPTEGRGRFTILSDAQARVARGQAHPVRAFPVGNYAIGFVWSDGHDDGIYTYAYLRHRCPCPEHGREARTPPDAEG